jgi:hypothetical protein
MLEKYFLKLGLCYSKYKFRKRNDNIQRFTDFLSGNSTILIILPNLPKQFDEAKELVLELSNKWHEKQITVIVRSQFASINEFKEHFHTIGITNENINKFFLPRKNFIEEIKNIGFDVTIDLNIDLFLPASFLTRVVNSKYRIGINKELSDLFYNFQFNPVEYDNYKNLYLKLFTNLNMFGQSGDKNEV